MATVDCAHPPTALYKHVPTDDLEIRQASQHQRRSIDGFLTMRKEEEGPSSGRPLTFINFVAQFILFLCFPVDSIRF